jgi:hypothetical protein
VMAAIIRCFMVSRPPRCRNEMDTPRVPEPNSKNFASIQPRPYRDNSSIPTRVPRYPTPGRDRATTVYRAGRKKGSLRKRAP